MNTSFSTSQGDIRQRAKPQGDESRILEGSFISEKNNQSMANPIHDKSSFLGGEKEDKIKVSEAWKARDRSVWLWLVVFTLLGFLTRFYGISHPDEVVFDEVHFGKFASYYLRGEFFFDVHPPLAKMVLALGGYLVGFKGHFDFEKIGLNYIEHEVPYIGLRATSALFGALNVPLVFMAMVESGYEIVPCIVAAGFVLLDNSLITQSRLILLDSQLVFFATLAIYCYIKFYKLSHREFSPSWWFWLLSTGVSLALTLGVKMVGLFTIATVGLAVVVDLWKILDVKRGTTMPHVAKHFFARVFGLILVPAIVYLSLFWIHFKILPRSGTGDAYMTPQFQATLTDNELFSKSAPIQYGDIITIKHKELGVYLHSHVDKYPLRYADGRISSQGQQVTGYPHEDANNYWMVMPEESFDDEGVDNAIHSVLNGDKVRLLHVRTNSLLLAHDVASPSMPTNEEITTVDADKVLTDKIKYPMTLFQLKVDNQAEGEVWKTHVHFTRLLHVETPIAVWANRKVLPDWGFKHNEINGDKKLDEPSNRWYIHSITNRNATADLKPKEPAHRNFFLKFWELQTQMLIKNNAISSSHPFATRPWQWPISHRGCSYWTKEKPSQEQIYILGNPVGYWLGTIIVLAFAAYLAADQLLLRRGVDTLQSALRTRVYHSGLFLLLGWGLHFLPFFPMGRQLFLHHYLPALIFKYMLIGATFQYVLYPQIDPATPNLSTTTVSTGSIVREPTLQQLHARLPTKPTKLALLVASMLLGSQLVAFGYFAPLTYGTSVGLRGTPYNLKWLQSWDFHFAKKPSAQIKEGFEESKPEAQPEVKDPRPEAQPEAKVEQNEKVGEGVSVEIKGKNATEKINEGEGNNVVNSAQSGSAEPQSQQDGDQVQQNQMSQEPSKDSASPGTN